MEMRTKPDRPSDDADAVRLRFDAFELDEAEARLTCDGRPLTVAPKAFAVLCALARQPGLLMTKSALLDAVWGHQFVSESVLKTTVSELRAALADDPKQPRYIETVPRRGYRFIGAASPLRASAAERLGRPIHAAQLPKLTGRERALTRLCSAWERTLAGQRQSFWIAGEPGIGKTTLIDHFVAALGPVAFARGQCVEQYGAGEPYLPVLEALAQLCRDDSTLTPVLRSVAPTWLLQLPWLVSEAEREALRRELAGTSQDRMLREFGELLDRYTQDRPLLLVTEDLHWSDHATVHLIDHVARRRARARLMWIASFRLAEVIAEDHPLKALRNELRLHRLCEEILLDPFSEQEIADYIVGRLPGLGATEPFVRALHARTDGLPLFVAHVLDDLVAQGVLRAGQQVPVDLRAVSTEIPENLAGIIDKQIGRLAPEQRTLLEAASVCGAEFRPGTVADALERDAGWVVEQCDELTRRQQWLGDAAVDRLADGTLDVRYAFRHALYRHVLYGRLGALARAQLHRRIGASLERSRAAGIAVAPAELASHFELGREPLAALRHYADAAQSALRHFAPNEAMNLSAHALSLVPQAAADPARTAVEFALTALNGAATAQSLGIAAGEAKQVFERALALLDQVPRHPLRHLVLHALGLVLMVRAEYDAASALAQRIQELAAADADRVLLLSECSIVGQVNALQGRPREAHEWLQQGVATCEAIGDDVLAAAFVVDPEVTLLGAHAIPLLHLGFADQAQARIAAARERAQRLGEPMAQLIAAWFGCLLGIRLDDVEGVAALAESMRAIVERASLAPGAAPSRWFRGWAQARSGAPREGYAQIRAGFDINAKLGKFSGCTEVLGHAAEALWLAGDFVAAQAQLDEAMQLAQRLGERVYLPQLWLLQGRLAAARGDARAAREAMLEARAEARRQGAPWLEMIALTAHCEAADAQTDDFTALAATLASLSEGFDTVPVTRARALLP